MGSSKSEKFTAAHNDIARIAKALAHPARVAIIEFIMAQSSCICNDIVAELPLSQSTVSQHLKELKEVGIIKGEIDGPKTCYCIDEKVWHDCRTVLLDFMRPISINDCC